MIRRTPLKRSSKPIAKVSKKRVNLNRVYKALSQSFLQKHPYCQHWIAENDLNEEEIVRSNGWYEVKSFHPLRHPHQMAGMAQVPRSCEIHHKRGRGKYYLDVSTFMAVRSGHSVYIHAFPKEAYEKGYMLPRN